MTHGNCPSPQRTVSVADQIEELRGNSSKQLFIDAEETCFVRPRVDRQDKMILYNFQRRRHAYNKDATGPRVVVCQRENLALIYAAKRQFSSDDRPPELRTVLMSRVVSRDPVTRKLLPW